MPERLNRFAMVLFALAAAISALAGCRSGGSSQYASPVTHQGGDSGCPLAGDGGCGWGADGGPSYIVEVVPPAGTGLVKTAKHYSLSKDYPVTFIIAEPVKCCGTVRKNSESIPGWISASQTGGTMPAGKSYTSQAYTWAGGEGQYDYCMLLPDSAHTLVFTPDDRLLPQARLVLADVKAGQDHRILYPDPIYSYSGTVYNQDMQPGTGVSGLLVRAVDPATGLESSRDETSDGKDGRNLGQFSISLPEAPGGGPLDLHVAPAASEPWPAVVFKGNVPGTGGSGAKIYMNAQNYPPKCEFEMIVKGRELERDMKNDVWVSFQTTIDVDKPYLQFLPMSWDSKRGGYSLNTSLLFAGEYRYTLYPPVNMDKYAMMTGGFNIESQGGACPVKTEEVPYWRKKNWVSIEQIYYPDGAGGGQVMVEAYWNGACNDGTETVPRTQGTPYTSARMQVSDEKLFLDDGLWDIWFVPPQGVNNAPAAIRGVCMTESASIAIRDLTLPRTRMLAGTVLDPASKPLPYATVNVYLDNADESGQALLVGSTLTGSTGAFELPIPDL
jgi:hypothetical protein